VAEVGAKRIIQIDPANGTVTEIAANLPIGLRLPPADCRATSRRRRRWGNGGDLLLVGYRECDLQGDEEVEPLERASPRSENNGLWIDGGAMPAPSIQGDRNQPTDPICSAIFRRRATSTAGFAGRTMWRTKTLTASSETSLS